MLLESTASENAEASSGETVMPVGADMVVVVDGEQKRGCEIGMSGPETRSGMYVQGWWHLGLQLVLSLLPLSCFRVSTSTQAVLASAASCERQRSVRIHLCGDSSHIEDRKRYRPARLHRSTQRCDRRAYITFIARW